MLQPRPKPPTFHPNHASLVSLGFVAGSFLLPVVVVFVTQLLLLPLTGLTLLYLVHSVVAVAVIAAHYSWWTYMSGRYDSGFGWALAAMATSHAALAFWVLLFAGFFGGPGLVQLALINILILFGFIALAMRSAASKYLVVCSLLVVTGLGILVCKINEHREIARRNSCVNSIRHLGLGLSHDEQRHVLTSDTTRPAVSHGDADGYSTLEDLLPYIEESMVAEDEWTRDPLATD